MGFATAFGFGGMERRSFDEFAVKLDYGDAFRFEHLMNVFFYTSNTREVAAGTRDVCSRWIRIEAIQRQSGL
jgi:hypothetical protein